jgi:ketopantoate hydroxymethyltransferase
MTHISAVEAFALKAAERRTYANAFDIIQAALNAYDHDVKSGNFPNDRESYSQIHQFNREVA